MLRQAKVVRLSFLTKVLFPSILIPSVRKSAIGFSFVGGKFGLFTGLLTLFASSLCLYLSLAASLPLLGLVIFWLVGNTSILMIVNVLRPVAFVKNYCFGCELREIIIEHESYHVNGYFEDERIWEEMRKNYKFELLKNKKGICPFCPIKKRVGEE